MRGGGEITLLIPCPKVSSDRDRYLGIFLDVPLIRGAVLDVLVPDREPGQISREDSTEGVGESAYSGGIKLLCGTLLTDSCQSVSPLSRLEREYRDQFSYQVELDTCQPQMQTQINKNIQATVVLFQQVH